MEMEEMRDEAVAEDALAREAGDDLADDAHGGQNHDVDGGMRVEPEQMLEEQRIAAEFGIEDAEVQGAFDGDQNDGDGDDGRAENLDDAGGVVGPDEQRQARPGHARAAHAVDGDDEVQAGEDGGESGDEDGESGFDDFGVGEGGAEGRVEGPAGIDAAGEHAVQHHDAADDVEIPAQQVDAREGEILGADHHGHEEVAEHGGNRRDEEEEDHDHAVHGEKLVVGVGLDEVAGGGEQFEADEQREEAADEKEEGDGEQVEQRDALVVRGEEPRADTVVLIEIILALSLGTAWGSHYGFT